MEKRSFKRIEKSFNVRVSSIINSNIESLMCKSINISASGMLFTTDRFFNVKIGDTIKVLFLKPNTYYFFDGTAKIIHMEQNKKMMFEIGIEFTNLDQNDKRMMDYYLHYS